MRRTLLILGAAAALFLIAAGGPAAEATPDSARPGNARLRAALDAVVAAGAPGAIALVRNGDRTVRLAAGYGNLARRTPMRVTDRFRIGSETKMFVSTVVLQLVERRDSHSTTRSSADCPGSSPTGKTSRSGSSSTTRAASTTTPRTKRSSPSSTIPARCGRRDS